MPALFKGVVHPWLCDAMGHLTTRHYVAMFDDAIYHLYQQTFGYAGPTGVFSGKGWADVRQVIEYKGELPLGALVEIHGELLKLGTKSVTSRYQMRNLVTGEISATLENVTVYFDLERRMAIPLTKEMRAQAEEFFV